MFPMLAVAGSALQAAGSIWSGFAQSDAYKASAGIKRSNAKMTANQAVFAEDAADLHLTRGAWDAAQVAAKVRATQGMATSMFAGRGIDSTMGSPLLMAGFSAGQGDTDMALAAARGEVAYADARTQSANQFGRAASLEADAAADEQKAINARVAGFFGAGTALLQAGSKWPSLGGDASPMNIGGYSMPRIGSGWGN